MPAPRILGIPGWAFPILAGFTWLVTLLSMIASWVVKGSTHYPEMFPMQHLPYISNIGASDWGHPLFIVGSAVTAALFSIAFVSERWLRHTSHLIHSSSTLGTFFWSVAALLTTLSTCTQVLFTVFCVRRHAYTHYCLVAVFALSSIFAAAFMCAEKNLLCNRFPTNKLLRRSLWIKLFFIAIEVLLVVLGSITMFERMYRTSIVIEWMAALFFTFYLSSFAIDFMALPADDGKDDNLQLLPGPWEEEAGLSRPARMYTLTPRRCIDTQ